MENAINEIKQIPRDLAKEIVGFYKDWNDTYHRIIYFIGAIGGAIIVFSLSFVFDFITQTEFNAKIDIFYIKLMFCGLGIILFSLMNVFANIFATYNWFIRTTLRVYSNSGTDITEIAKDNKYSQAKNKKDIESYEKRSRLLGWASYYTGWIAGISLVIGIACYTIAIWKIVNSVLH